MPSPSDSSFDGSTPIGPAIVVHDVTKTFRIKHHSSMKESFIGMFRRKNESSLFHALDHIDFEVAEGESVAVLGHNGSGKSTTLKLISGVQQPDGGWVRTRGRIGGLLEVGAGFHPDLTGRDNIYLNSAILGMTKDETEDRFDDITDFSGISPEFLDIEVKRYSSGMRSRLGFAVAVHTQIDVLLVDEVLSVGDAEFRAKCNDKLLDMRAEGKTMFIVSHNLGTVKKLCDRGIVLDHGKVIFDGPIDEAAAIIKPPAQSKLSSKRNTASSKKPSPVNTSEFSIAPEFMYLFNSREYALGQPTSDPVDISHNGGGTAQHFTRGYVTRSDALNVTQFVRPGAFLEAYEKAGGPSGPWGFVVGRLEGSRTTDEEVRMRFQMGLAFWNGNPDSQVSFIESPLTPNENR